MASLPMALQRRHLREWGGGDVEFWPKGDRLHQHTKLVFFAYEEKNTVAYFILHGIFYESKNASLFLNPKPLKQNEKISAEENLLCCN